MILLWGVPRDEPLAAVRRAIESLGAPLLFLDQFAVLDCEIALSVGKDADGATLQLDGVRHDLADISAIYLRPYDSGRVLAAAGIDDAAALARARAFDQAMLLHTELTTALVVNRPSAMASNASKPWQAELIRRAGFAVPETLLTTDAGAARAFRRRHDAVIYKSVGAVRSRVSELTDATLSRFVDTACPVHLQRRVIGGDLRVHVVGDDAFGATVTSSAVDYRYPASAEEAPRVAAAELPDTLGRRCVALAHELGLPVAGIDLRQEGADWLCFEVNPSPAFTYYSVQTGQDIAGAIAALLAAAPRTPMGSPVGPKALPANSPKAAG